MGKPAARIGDHHVCPMVTGVVPHVGGPVVTAQPNVLIAGRPAARIGDNLVCAGPPDTIAQGEPTVLIGGKPAARMGDSTVHGGKIVIGAASVLIGGNNQVTLGRVSVTVKTTSKDGKKSTMTLTENDRIAGVPIDTIKSGSPNKVVIIGRRMAGHVLVVAAALEAQGVNVEIFDADHQMDPIVIDGKIYTWDMLNADFKNNSINPTTGLPTYKCDPNNPNYIAEEDVPNTLMYKANKQWVASANKNGATVINIGYPPPPPSLAPSVFYNMELSIIDF